MGFVSILHISKQRHTAPLCERGIILSKKLYSSIKCDEIIEEFDNSVNYPTEFLQPL